VQAKSAASLRKVPEAAALANVADKAAGIRLQAPGLLLGRIDAVAEWRTCVSRLFAVSWT